MDIVPHDIKQLRNHSNNENIIPYGKHFIDEEDIQAVVNTLRSKHLTQGPLINDFEEAISQYVGSKYAVAVSSCTAGLHIACKSLGINSESIVAVPTNSFVSTANCASFLGAKIEFFDINIDSLNISIDKLEEYLSCGNHIDLIIAVHFAGFPVELERLYFLSSRYGFKIIEDAAHALGSKQSNGKRIGSCEFSDISVFSLHPVKSIAAGEGGVITTNNEEIYMSLLRLRSHGINKGSDELLNKEYAFTGDNRNLWYYEMRELGFHYRITDIQCALALSQLKKLNNFIERRRDLASYYRKKIESINFINPAQKESESLTSNHIFPVRIDFDTLNIKRNDLMIYLRKNLIYTQVHYIPIPIHPYYKNMGYNEKDFNNNMKYFNEALTLPLYYQLKNEQVDYVLTTLKNFFKNC